jgi:glutaredoxin 3
MKSIIIFLFSSFFANAQINENNIKSKIYIYGSESCHTCIDTKKFLEKEKIEFQFYDIDTNLEKQKEMIYYLKKNNISLNNLNLPAARFEDKIITNVPNFEEFLQNILKLIKK